MLLTAIHGILTSQTDPSWPDKFDAWMFQRDPAIKVLKKEYCAGPFPCWNCWVKDPWLARGLANEIELFLNPKSAQPIQQAPATASLSYLRGRRGVGRGGPFSSPIWFVAHSNGAVIALLAAHRLIQRGYHIGGLILTGAACDADLQKNRILEWLSTGALGAAISYSSEDDHVIAGDPRVAKSLREKLRDWLWGKLMWPYGSLGRTGWLCSGKPLHGQEFNATEPVAQASSPASAQAVPGGHSLPIATLLTRWYPGGHSTYFTPANLERTFQQIYDDVLARSRSPHWRRVEPRPYSSHPAHPSHACSS